MAENNREPWIVAIETAVNEAAAKYGLHVGAYWDDEDDGGIEIIIFRQGATKVPSPALHGRISAVMEDCGDRFAWWRLAWQGHGGTQIMMEPTPEAATSAVRSIYEMFRCEDSRQERLG